MTVFTRCRWKVFQNVQNDVFKKLNCFISINTKEKAANLYIYKGGAWTYSTNSSQTWLKQLTNYQNNGDVISFWSTNWSSTKKGKKVRVQKHILSGKDCYAAKFISLKWQASFFWWVKADKASTYQPKGNISKVLSSHLCESVHRLAPDGGYGPVFWEMLMLPVGSAGKANWSTTPFRGTLGICERKCRNIIMIENYIWIRL